MGGCIIIFKVTKTFQVCNFVLCVPCGVLNLTVCVLLFAILTSRHVYCVSRLGRSFSNCCVLSVRNGCLHLTARITFYGRVANLLTWAIVYKTNYPYINTDVINGITVDIKNDTDDVVMIIYLPIHDLFNVTIWPMIQMMI